MAEIAGVTRKGNAVQLTLSEGKHGELWHDCLELEKLLHKTETAPALAADLCAGILSLYRGSFLPTCYMEWANQYRDRLELRLTQFLTRAVRASDQLPDALRAEVAHRLLEIDACHQLACAELMGQSLKAGRPEEALRLFKKVESRLRSDLGMEPEIKLLELAYRAEIGLSA